MSDNEQQQTEAPKEGFIALHSDYYFTCSSGLAPAKICPTQNNACTKEKYSYLIHHDTATQNIGDFFCRWTVVLAAAVAAAGIVTGGAALVALAAVAVVASGTMCGGLMAPMRKWVGYSQLNTYGGKTITLSNKPKHDLALGIGVLCGGPFIGLVIGSKTTGILDSAIDKLFPPQVVGGGHSLTSKCQMVCPIGGTITYAPGITGFWSAALYTARNTAWAVLEGFFVGKFVSSGGALFTGGGKILTGQFLKNFVFLQASARGAGIADQVFFEGMLRNGKSISETGDEAYAGSTMFEQPFINIWNRSNEGYYDGSYAKDAEGNYLPEADNGHGTGALLTDAYYAGLSLMGLKAMVDASRQNVNIPKETVEAIRKTVNDAIAKGKSFLFERGRRGQSQRVATNWRDHQNNVTQELRENNPNTSVHEQVYLDVQGTDVHGNPFSKRIIADQMYDTGNGSYQIIDSKFSSVNDLTTVTSTDLRNTFTNNQKPVYDAIGGNGSITSVSIADVPSSHNMGLTPGQISVSGPVQIAVNTPNGIIYRTYP
ncbi:hypothetical protein O2K51_01850 [Apibacter raozihei]|uniref:hypothetical protein n=1 Tax=Apibacter raozihei TaxID=2500547 RepID=UPI000FE37279|nr:hypothetical protein [Apibacter raozihei]